MTVEIGSISEIVTAFVAISGVCVSLCEYSRANKIKRSSYLEPLIDKMKSKEISEIVYMFQYGNFEYNDSFHKSGELERKVDKALQYFSYLCYLRKKRIISIDEFSFFELEISQALRDKSLIDYLYNLFHFACKIENYKSEYGGFKKNVYSNLLQYAKEKKLIDDTFFDKKAYQSGLYPRYLNF